MTTLKPCPFCGGAAKLKPTQRSAPYPGGLPLYYVECSNDECETSLNFGEFSESEAIAAWNARSPTVPPTTPSSYPLFNHMLNEHGLTLVESELSEIMIAAEKCKPSPWIAFSERMPEAGMYVLASVLGGDLHVAKCRNGFWFDWRLYDIQAVTHWMPLPKAPDENKK